MSLNDFLFNVALLFVKPMENATYAMILCGATLIINFTVYVLCLLFFYNARSLLVLFLESLTSMGSLSSGLQTQFNYSTFIHKNK